MGVWTQASPKALARRVPWWILRSRSCGASSDRRWRPEAVPGCRRGSIKRARVGAVAVLAFGVPNRAGIRRTTAPRAR